MRLAEALDDRVSFRPFCGFAAHEPTPERTAFVRVRAELVRRGLDRSLFEAVTRQLDGRGVVVRTGRLVDALVNAEPHKCGALIWAPIEGLPADTVDYVREAIEQGFTGSKPFLELGFEVAAADAEVAA